MGAFDPEGRPAPASASVPESAAPAASAGDPLAEVLDEHAEVREILAQLREAPDREGRAGLLARLEALLAGHFAREEQGGVLALIGAAPGGKGVAARLAREHGEILSGVRALAARVRSADAAALERDTARLLAQLQEHDRRESALLHAQVGVEAAPGGRPTPSSKALEVNLRRTAVEVVIPPDQRLLLELCQHLHGVHESTKALLHEINHRYVGWEQTIEDLHRRAMGDFAYYLADARAPEAIEVFCNLYEKAVDEAAPAALRESALRRYLQYLRKVASESGERRSELDAPLAAALGRLRECFEGAPELGVLASPGLKQLARALVSTEPQTEAAGRCLELLAEVLAQVHRQWLAREDPEGWWRELVDAPAGAAPPEAVAEISHARLRANLARLAPPTDAAQPQPARGDVLLELPDAGRFERAYLAAAASVESPERETWRNRVQRVRWLIRLLAEGALRQVHDEALAEIHRACVHALREAEAASVSPLVREVFAILRRSDLSASPTALALISRLGTEALAARDPAWTEAFLDQLLDWDFAYPEFAGFTEEWQPRVNPAHVGAIRAFLDLIEVDPEGASPLAAALVVHLALGGIFLADTDVFQRDVSKLLNSPIEPIYHPVKQLLRLLPVYFADIGAEGELREVSSRIDEIGGRRDPLCHFLRKQCHVESNPELVGLIEATGRFWATGRREALRRYVPRALYGGIDGNDSLYAGLRRVFDELVRDEPLEALFALDPGCVETRIEKLEAGSEGDREKARLLFRLRELVGHKYEIRHDDVVERLAAFRRLPRERVEDLSQALAAGDNEAAIDAALAILEELKDLVLAREASEAREEIYRKRHIAAGIPSLYGSYREEKFDAVGLGFRVESLATALFEQLIAQGDLHWMTHDALQRVLRWLRLLRRALWIDGCRARGLTAGIGMLEQAVETEGIDVQQYVNIFQTLSRSVEQVVRIRYLDIYEEVLHRILPRMFERGVLRPEPGSTGDEAQLKISEAFLRDLIARSFGLQQLDQLVGRVLRGLVRARDSLAPQRAALLMGYDVGRSCVEIEPEQGPLDGAVRLGNKGYMLKRLARYGLPVPHGFILTTEVFRCRPAILSCPELIEGVKQTLRRQVARLERLSGCRFGDPQRPLMLSVRSGSAITMPGMLDTFLNVGMNEAIAEGFAKRSGSPWAAWDAYRRFLQLYGMAHGIERDLFDALIRETKELHGAAKKAQLAPERMRELSLRYRELLRDHGVEVDDDPFAQLVACVDLVLGSWDSEKARVYRDAMQIADAWGTAVIVQNMVYGNLHQRSGTGVVSTFHPGGRPTAVGLRGDFVVQGQGDDVVGGLVETFPICADERRATMSLERDFPAIHAALAGYAALLVRDRGMFHQEIEFTFESEDPADLYVLQTRDSVMAEVASVSAFVPSEALDAAKISTGVGAGGGALCGRVAHSAADVETLRRRFPDDAIILLRPDTVPDDVPLVLRSNGMVTALGGATSHAALVAQRVGLTCVVGCRQLDVDEREGRSRIAGHTVETGDIISINGIDGSVYLGRHPTTTVRRERFV